MNVKTRLTRIEQSADAARPKVALAFLDSPDGTPIRLFNNSGAELPPDTDWQAQKPPAKVFVDVDYDRV